MNTVWPSMRGKRALVTGGAGFIGSNLVKALLDAGTEQVTVLDNFSTGKRENLAPFAGNPRFRLIAGDIRNRGACREAVAGAQIVFHEAALGSVPRSIADPATTVEVNIAGFVNLLKTAVDAGAGRFVYASSSSVYGDSAELPKVEARTGKPLSPYAITKCADELFAENFHAIYGIDTVGLRYFNVFGPNQDPSGPYAAVIPRFATALLAHRPPVINGDGSCSRDFTYVDNVVEANFLAALTEEPEALNRCYNVAAGEETTLLELFRGLRREIANFAPEAAKLEPRFGPPRAGDIKHSRADIALARRLLRYEPLCLAPEGFARTAAWYWNRSNGGRNA